MKELAEQCPFPWLLSNILWKAKMEPLFGTKLYHIIEHKGRKIGFIGLAELAWIETLNSITMDQIVFEDFVDCARRYIHILKVENGCDMVIALTHM